ncbi:MAG: hypothetical protein WA902_06915 [Thermosynechococcaceae cyanobacterium]
MDTNLEKTTATVDITAPNVVDEPESAPEEQVIVEEFKVSGDVLVTKIKELIHQGNICPIFINSESMNQQRIQRTPNYAKPAQDSSAPPLQRLILKAGLLYFAVGFVLGPIRLLWGVPHFGTRVSELLEMPLMLVAIILAARWVVQRLTIPARRWVRLGMGMTALSLLLSAEMGLVLWLRGISIQEYLTSRDPVSGSVYLLLLGVFAAMPLLISARADASLLGGDG